MNETMPDTTTHLSLLLDGCRRGERNSQRKLYEHFHGYGMSVSLRYARHRTEALEILNDTFLKVFSKLGSYDSAQPFKPWLRSILVRTAIDHHRANGRLPAHLDLEAAHDLQAEDLPVLSPDEDALPLVQQLPPVYRLVFNLYVMEDYDHREIAEMLHISESTSRSNLARAKEKLRELLLQQTEQDKKQTLRNRVPHATPQLENWGAAH